MHNKTEKLLSDGLPLPTRREFLISSMAFGAATLFAKPAEGTTESFDHVFRVIRDDDLMQLEFHFLRWRRMNGKLRAMGTGDSLIAVRFPPQNLAEAIFEEKHDEEGFENAPLPVNEGSPTENDPRAPIKCYLSGPSWLVFRANNGVEVPLDVERWLRLASRLDLKVAAGALGPWTPRPPAQDETRLEIPYRLYISPEPDTVVSATQWKQSSRIPSSRFREMWHATLQSRRPVKPAPPPEGFEEDKVPDELKAPRSCALHARALWSPDYRPEGEPPFALYYPAFQPLSIHALTRHRLVKQMAAGDGWIDAEHLILTALGADASFHYNSQKPIAKIIEEQIAAESGDGLPDPGTNLHMWKHRIVIGRDVFFAEALFGFLLPLNSVAVYVEITKRKFGSVKVKDEQPLDHPPGAFLLKRRFILVINDQQHFASSASAIGRSMPLKNVRLKMLRSPDLKDPVVQDDPGKKPGLYFFPKDVVTEENIHWPMEMFDESGKSAEPSRAWLLFASNIMAGHRIYRDDKQVSDDQRTFLFPGSKVALAPERPILHVVAPPGTGETDHLTELSANTMLAAEKLGEELEKSLVGLREDLPGDIHDIAEKVRDQFGQAVADAEQAVKEELTKLGTATRQAETEAKATLKAVHAQAKDALAKAEQWYLVTKEDIGDKRSQFMTAWGDMVTQLRRAKSLSASLEIKAIRFASGFVRDEIALGRIILAEINAGVEIQGLVRKLKDNVNVIETEFGKVEEHVRNRMAALLTNLEIAERNPAWLRQRVERFATDLGLAGAELEQAGSQYFHPIVEEVEAVIPAVKQLLPEIQSSSLKIFEDYVAGGIRAVKNGTYASLKKAIGKAENIGQQIKNGVAQPAAIVAGVSREVGAVMAEGEEKLKELSRKAEDLTKPVKDTVQKYGQDISNAIPNAKILGVLDLRKMVGLLARGQMPDMNMIELPDKLEHVWAWSVTLQEKDFGFLKFKNNVKSNTGFSLNLQILSTTTVHLPPPKEIAGGAKPWTEVKVEGYLGCWDETKKGQPPQDKKPDYTFALNLLNLIEARFREVNFTSHFKQGESPQTSVKPELVGVEFLGPMNFVKKLQDMLGLKNFKVDITPTYIFVGSETNLPPITTGFFCLRGVRLFSSLELPFRNDPLRYRFDFATFTKPFELSVMGFAGRGFLSVEIESNGNRMLEGALEFGGALSFDIVVASGGLYVMAGVYFRIDNTGTELSGYLRAGGFLDVLGLLTASVEFMLMLRYRSAENALWGICTVTVSIDMGLWDWDVSLTMEKKLAGSGPSASALTRQVTGGNTFMTTGAAEPDPTAMPYFGYGKVKGHYNSGSRCSSAGQTWRRDYYDHFDLSCAT